MIAGSLHPVTGTKAPVQIILTSGISWTVPSDWNSAANKIECGGAGKYGGGAYACKNNLALTPGRIVSYQIGTPSTSHTIADTWFVSTSAVKAVGATGTAGGAAASCVGDVKYSGGDGGSNSGGGAAGPHGDGLPGEIGGTGGAGDAGFGGLGGVYPPSGTPGGNGTEWGAAGSGGGGGFSGNGGLYGGGTSSAGTATGAPGLIVITYTPA